MGEKQENLYEITGNERFWVGPLDPDSHLVYKMQSRSTEKEWLQTVDNTVLDKDYSEFSVRIYDPQARSLSFINRTMAILPKSRLRSIHALIGAYLDAIDSV